MIRGLLGRNYILLWLGQFVSQMGNRLYLMALAWYFVSVADDSAGLFTVFIVSSLPSLFLGPFIGPLVERWNKKRIMVCCDLVSAGLVGLLGWIVSRDAASNYAIYAICFALNSVNLLFSPAINSIIPAILPPEKYQAGMSYIKMITFLGQILGAAVGGILVGFLGVYLTIVVNAVSFFLSGLSEMFIRFRPPAVRRSGNYAGALKAGINYVRRSPVVRRVLSVSVACNLFIPALMVFLPIVIKTQMGLDAKAYGLADAMMPAGAVFVAVLLARRRELPVPGRVCPSLGGLVRRIPADGLRAGLFGRAVLRLRLWLFHQFHQHPDRDLFPENGRSRLSGPLFLASGIFFLCLHLAVLPACDGDFRIL